MARSRNIKPGFFENVDLAELSVYARLLFIGLWTLADREGRLEDRPKQIRFKLMPYDDFDPDTTLQQLHDSGFILRYQADGANYIQVTNFLKHQTPHCKEKESIIPAPDLHQTSTVQTPPDSLIPDSLIPDSSIKTKANNSEREVSEEKTENEIAFECSFDQKESVLRKTYPHADFEAEKLTCIAYYRGRQITLDPYVLICQWFNRLSKSGNRGSPRHKTDWDALTREYEQENGNESSVHG